MSRDEDDGGHKGVVDVDVMIATQKFLFQKVKAAPLATIKAQVELSRTTQHDEFGDGDQNCILRERKAAIFHFRRRKQSTAGHLFETP